MHVSRQPCVAFAERAVAVIPRCDGIKLASGYLDFPDRIQRMEFSADCVFITRESAAARSSAWNPNGPCG